MKKLALLLCLVAPSAWAQSSPGWPIGFVPTAAQWNAVFASKQDYITGTTSFPSLNVNGTSTFAGQILSTMIGGTPATDVGWLLNAVNTVNYPPNGHGYRDRYWKTTATMTGNSSGIWEPNFFFCDHAGTGTMSGETNCVHPFSQYAAGLTFTGDTETFEASAANNGAVLGHWIGALSQLGPNSGTVTSATGFEARYGNNSGTIGVWAGFDCEAGSGSAPTSFNLCLRNADLTAAIVSLGALTVGALASPGNLVDIIGRGLTGATFPFAVKNNSSTRLFDISDAGGVTIPAFLTVGAGAGAASTIALYVQGADTNAAHVAIAVKDSASAALFTVFNDGGSVIGAATGLTKGAGTLNVAGVYYANGTAGVNCSGATTGSFAAVNGIVTHC